MEVSGAVSSALDPGPGKVVSPPEGRDPLARAFFLAALLLAGLRFVALGRWSLWLDEALTLADTETGGTEANPFGYWLFAWLYSLSAGRPDEAWMRLPAAAFGLTSILATGWALRPFVGARAAALGAFFVAASSWQLYWAQNARFYTLAQTLGLLGGGLFLRGLLGGTAGRTALGLGFLVLAALTHPSAVFLIGPLFVLPWIANWVDWLPSESRRGRAWGLFAAVSLFAFVLGSGWALKTWLRWESRQGSGTFLHFAKTAGYWLTPTVALAFLVGLARGWRDRRAFVPVAAAGLGFAVAALASLFLRVSAQYVFVLQPWAAACAGLALAPPGTSSADGPRRRRCARLALLVALPGLLETALYFGLRNGDRPRWREAYAYVSERRGPLDLVLGMEAPVAEYYLQPSSRALRRWTEATWLDDFRSHVALDWARYARRTWFVVNETQFDDWTGQADSRANRAEVERILREECERVASFEIPLTPRDLDVHVYVTRP
jgi:hypothetical protein